VVVVTHDPGVAERFERVVVVRDGRLVPQEERVRSAATRRYGPLGKIGRTAAGAPAWPAAPAAPGAEGREGRA
jgi:hypothetical protein